MISRSHIRRTISRERAARRVVNGDEFDHFDTKIKFSKLPVGFLNFENIDLLPPRELAYTAHLAGRLEMVNEDLWEKIRDAFLESAKSMKGKHVTQCLVALARREEALKPIHVSHILRTVSSTLSSYRPMDLVLVLHAVSALPDGKGDRALLRPIVDRLAQQKAVEILNPKSIVVLTAAVGKLGIASEELKAHLLTKIADNKCRFNQHEVAAIVRGIASALPSSSRKKTVVELLDATDLAQMEPGTLSIILNSIWKLNIDLPQNLRERVWIQLSSSLSLAEADLLPHLLLSCSGIVTPEDLQGLTLCLRIANTVSRRYKQFKAVALPVAVEGLEMLKCKFPMDPDVKTVSDNLTSITQSVISGYLLLAPEEERRQVLESKYCHYSPWLKAQVEQSLTAPILKKEKPAVDLVARIVRGEVNPQDAVAGMSEKELDPITVVRLLWLGSPMTDAMRKVLESTQAPMADEFYSLLFRCASRHNWDEIFLLNQILHLFIGDMGKCSIKTVCRAIQGISRLPSIESTLKETIIHYSLSRVLEIHTEDLHGYLSLLSKLGARFDVNTSFAYQFVDAVEAKVAAELNQVKSLSRRTQIESLCRDMGLSYAFDLIEEIETTLAEERKGRRNLEH